MPLTFDISSSTSHTSRILRACICLAALACGAPTFGQDLVPKAAAQKEPIIIENATIHTVSGKTLEKAWIYFNNGKIQSLGDGPTPRFIMPVRSIDATGKHVYPGLFSPYSQLGLTEIQSVRATIDSGETGQMTPETRAVVAVNPDSTLLPVTRSNGVLLGAIFPSSGLISGRAGVIRLDGWTWEEMAIDADSGMVINWPLSRPITAAWMDQPEEDQQRDIDRNARSLEDFIVASKAYAAARSADSFLPTDLRFEAMRSLSADGAARRPVFAACNDADQIRAAVAFCVKHNLKCVILGGRDATSCAEILKKHSVPVIVNGGTFRFPRRDDAPYDDAYTLPARLQAAGITWALANGDDTAHERNLPYAAAMAVAHGLDHDAAIRAITLTPAEIFGLAGSYGSLEPEKSATLIIADGDILEVSTNVLQCFIDGRELDMDDKQKALERKYREKYEQQGELKGQKK